MKNSTNKYEDFLKDNQQILINVTLVHDKDIKKLNKKHLNRDMTTDVLSFGVEQKIADDTFYLGDIVVNVDQAKKQASDYKNTHFQEISELVGHGVLHLLGVHHPDDDEHSIHGISNETTSRLG